MRQLAISGLCVLLAAGHLCFGLSRFADDAAPESMPWVRYVLGGGILLGLPYFGYLGCLHWTAYRATRRAGTETR